MTQKSLYSPETFEAICVEYESGKSLVQICKEMGIPRTSFLFWVHKDEDHEERFSEAKLKGGFMAFEQAREIFQALKEFKRPVDLDPKAYSAWVRALEVAAHGKLRVAGILNSEYKEKQTVVNRDESFTYVLSFDPAAKLVTPRKSVTTNQRALPGRTEEKETCE